MDYSRQNFKNGNTLDDSQLNYIEDGILDLYNVAFIGNHCLNKPYNFEGKKAFFFGDSITYGYIKKSDGSAGRDSGSGYPKRFSDKVGLTCTNYGVSGSLFGNYNNLSRITDKIISMSSYDCDYLFIAGGINDWQCGISIEEFRQEIITVCEHLKNNYTGEVIFITPINHSGRKPIVTPKASVQEFRNTITEVALTYGFSIVQGSLFNFPTINSPDSYKVALFGDNLHPSELGYEVYAKSLITALC